MKTIKFCLKPCLQGTFPLCIIMITVCVFLLPSCDSIASNNELIVIKIETNKKLEFLEVDKMGRNINLTPLGLGDATVIGYPQKIFIVDSTIVLIDNLLHQILFYDLTGSLNKKVEKGWGEGPGEFNFLECFAVDEQAKEVVIYDSRLFKFLKYSFEGEFISEHKVDFFARDIKRIDGTWFINNAWSYNQDNPYQILIANNEFEITSKMRIQGKAMVGVHANTDPFIEYNGIPYYYEPLCDTVYLLDTEKERLIPYLFLDFGAHAFDEDDVYMKGIREFSAMINKGDYKGWSRNLYLSDYHTLFQYFDSKDVKKVQNVIAYIKKEEAIRQFKRMSFKGIPIMYPSLRKNNLYYSIISSEEIKAHLEDGGDKDVFNFFLNDGQKMNPSQNTNYLLSYKL